MSFFKRIGLYLIGLSIGLVFLAFFFKEKRTEFCYLPNCRVLKHLRTSEISLSEDIKNDSLYTIEEIKQTILKDGSVDFDKSDVRTKPCKTYFVSGIIRKKDVTVNIQLCGEKSIINSID